MVFNTDLDPGKNTHFFKGNNNKKNLGNLFFNQKSTVGILFDKECFFIRILKKGENHEKFA